MVIKVDASVKRALKKIFKSRAKEPTNSLDHCLETSEEEFVNQVAMGQPFALKVNTNCAKFAKTKNQKKLLSSRVQILTQAQEELIPRVWLVNNEEKIALGVAFQKYLENPRNVDRTRNLFHYGYEMTILFAIMNGNLANANGFGLRVHKRLEQLINEKQELVENGFLEKAFGTVASKQQRVRELEQHCGNFFTSKAQALWYDQKRYEAVLREFNQKLELF